MNFKITSFPLPVSVGILYKRIQEIIHKEKVVIRLTLNPSAESIQHSFFKSRVNIGSDQLLQADLVISNWPENLPKDVSIIVSQDQHGFFITNPFRRPEITLNGVPFFESSLVNGDELSFGEERIMFEGIFSSLIDADTQRHIDHRNVDELLLALNRLLAVNPTSNKSSSVKHQLSELSHLDKFLKDASMKNDELPLPSTEIQKLLQEAEGYKKVLASHKSSAGHQKKSKKIKNLLSLSVLGIALFLAYLALPFGDPSTIGESSFERAIHASQKQREQAMIAHASDSKLLDLELDAPLLQLTEAIKARLQTREKLLQSKTIEIDRLLSQNASNPQPELTRNIVALISEYEMLDQIEKQSIQEHIEKLSKDYLTSYPRNSLILYRLLIQIHADRFLPSSFLHSLKPVMEIQELNNTKSMISTSFTQLNVPSIIVRYH